MQRQRRLGLPLDARPPDAGGAALARAGRRGRLERLGGAGPHGSLCCGLAGRAYALLNLYKQGGGDSGSSAPASSPTTPPSPIDRTSESPDSLYKGAVGVAALAADLTRPAEAAMPFFEEEGWL